MNWVQRNFKTLIYIAFLVPILTVAFVSISHVTSWYGLSNPISWAIYLSIGIEIAALSALAAISAQMGRKVYFPFLIVTIIQFIGNIFFAYQFIDVTSKGFLDWVDLVDPLVSFMGVESGDIVGHKRFLALFSGGMLPIISLSFLHMLVKFEEEDRDKKDKNQEVTDYSNKEPEIDIDELSLMAGKMEAEIEKEKFTPTEEQLKQLENFLVGSSESKTEIQENKELVIEDIIIETPEPTIGEEEPEHEIGFEEVEVTPSEIDELISPSETPTAEKKVENGKNRLSYGSRNGLNISVQKI